MKPNQFITPLLATILALAPLGAAEKPAEKQKPTDKQKPAENQKPADKQKKSAAADFPFWTSKKRGYVTQFVPGLNAALQITEAQSAQIAAAQDEMSNDEGVKAARGISNSDPSVTPEQREKSRAAVEAATKKLHEKVAKILTPEQNALIEKINAAYLAAVEDVGVIYADKFASVKADEAARKRMQEEKNTDTEEHFFHKLDALLTPAQKETMKRAAAEEEERNARNAKAAPVKKPAK